MKNLPPISGSCPGTLLLILGAAWVVGFCSVPARAAEELDRYFDGLRQRQLYDLAEGYCLERLADPQSLTVSLQAQYTIQLSRTFAAHAATVSGEEQEDLWKRADEVGRELLTRQPDHPWKIPLKAQLVSTAAARGEALRWQAELFPGDQSLQQKARKVLQTAIPEFQQVLSELEASISAAGSTPPDLEKQPSIRKLRDLKTELQLMLALSQLNLARLQPEAQSTLSQLIEAESLLRGLNRREDENQPNWMIQLKLVECARLKKEYDHAIKMMGAMLEKNPPQGVQDQLTAERVRLLLTIGRSPEATSILSKLQTERVGLPGELQFLYVQSLIDLWKIAQSNKETELAQELWDQVASKVAQLDEAQGGYWGYRTKLVFSSARETHEYGAQLTDLIRQAREKYSLGQVLESARIYQQASALAAKQNQPGFATEFGFMSASILLQANEFEAAAKQFQEFAQQHPSAEQTPQAHLLWAYCLARIYDQNRTRENREAYMAALEEHRERFLNSPTRGEATWMLAQLQERRLQATKALQLYLDIPADHPRGPLARVSVARCYETILQRLRELNESQEYWRIQAIRHLERFLADAPLEPQNLTLPQAEIALRYSRILLGSESEQVNQADPWLVRIIESAERIQKSGVPAEQLEETWKPLKMAAVQMRIISLASQGQIREAEELVSTLAQTDPTDVLYVLDGLMQVGETAEPEVRRELGLLQLRAAETLGQRRSQLTAEEQDWLDRCLAQAYVATNQSNRAIEVYEKLLAESPQDLPLLRSVGELLIDCGSEECLSKARRIWKQLESQLPVGNPDWLNARYHIALCHSLLGEDQESRKLLRVTKVLYPQLGGEALKAKFTELESKVEARLKP